MGWFARWCLGIRKALIMIMFDQTTDTKILIYDSDFGDGSEPAAMLQYVDGRWELNTLNGDYIMFIEDLEIIIAKMKELNG